VRHESIAGDNHWHPSQIILLCSALGSRPVQTLKTAGHCIAFPILSKRTSREFLQLAISGQTASSVSLLPTQPALCEQIGQLSIFLPWIARDLSVESRMAVAQSLRSSKPYPTVFQTADLSCKTFGASLGADSSREYSFQNRHAPLYLTCITPCEAQDQRGLQLVLADI